MSALRIPFLKPRLPLASALAPYLEQIDETRWYSNFGPLNQRFEQSLLDGFFNGQGALCSMCNATIALMLGIGHMKRQGGTYAVMPSFTFGATPLAAIWSGLTPYFVDVDPASWCLDHSRVGEALDTLGDKVAVVVPVATFGHAMDLSFYEGLMMQGVPVVVDAAPNFGTLVDSLQYGHGFSGLVAYSLHATKPFGIGEGGLLYSANETLIQELRQSSNFGFTPEKNSELPGLNGKLSEYGAAVGLAVLDGFHDKRNSRETLERAYADAFASHGVREAGFSTQETTGRVIRQFIPLLCPPGIDSQEVCRQLLEQGIEARNYFNPPCHVQQTFQDCPRGDLAVTNDLSSRILSLPLWEDMPLDHVETIVAAVRQLCHDQE